MAERYNLFSSEPENEGSSVGDIAPAMSHVAPAPGGVGLLGPAVSYVAPAPVDGFSGPVTFSAPVEDVALFSVVLS